MPEEICVWISDPARRTFRRGHRPWHLTNPVYTGRWVFNKRDSRTQEKPVKEHVTVEVPVIISTAEFDAVAATLKTSDPRVTAPRVVAGRILLTGIATCRLRRGHDSADRNVVYRKGPQVLHLLHLRASG